MAKPSAVTEIETIPYSVRVLCVCGCTPTFVRVLHAEETERKKCAIVAYHIIKKKSDSANSVSVRIQITNKCRTLLNRPLAIIAGPTRHFQNL